MDTLTDPRRIPLTRKQKEKWQAAVPLLDYTDFQALRQEELEAFGKRIQARRGAPCWAIEIRRRCIDQAWRYNQPWVPEFALRSEIAMVGLKVLTTNPDSRVELYRRLLLDFLHRALAPFSPNVAPLEDLRTLCQNRGAEEAQWAETRQAMEKERIRQGGHTIHPYSEASREAYIPHCLQLGVSCADLTRRILFTSPEKWWNTTEGGRELAFWLSWTHRRRIESGAAPVPGVKGPYQPVTNAFLAALEAECPPPDWYS